MGHFTEALGLSKYALYMQDYGGPVGFRMALAHPDRATALIVQNAVAHNEGLGATWKTRRAFWKDRAANEAALRKNLLSLETTRVRHVGHDPNVDRYDPDLWLDEFAFLSRPGQADIQTDLFYDYRTNVAAYPTWQAWLRQRQPKLLVLWGKYDPSFETNGGRGLSCRRTGRYGSRSGCGALCAGYGGRRYCSYDPAILRVKGVLSRVTVFLRGW
jgi:pimeloyl-ACP methyl ester carboxylesterase